MATNQGSRAKSGTQARLVHAGTWTEYSEYTASATLAAGDIIQMVKVPKGARLVDLAVAWNRLAAASTGSAVILNVGDGVDNDRYMTQLSASSTSIQRGIQRFDGMGYEYTADDTIDIVMEDLGTSALETAAAVFRMWATLSIDGSENL